MKETGAFKLWVPLHSTCTAPTQDGDEGLVLRQDVQLHHLAVSVQVEFESKN
jgi:hypothetical protein